VRLQIRFTKKDTKNTKRKKERGLVLLVYLAVGRQNKSPFAVALGDWFPLRTYFLSGKASPNGSEIVIVIIIVVIGEA
jgi:hypothetical protein